MRDQIVATKYWMLINSNVAELPQKDNQLALKKFRQGIKRIFLSQNILNFIHIIEEEDQKRDKQDCIDTIEVKVHYEVGSRDLKLHCHVNFLIVHRTKVTVRYTDIITYFASRYGLSVFANAQIKPYHETNFLRYLIKDLKTKPKMVINNQVLTEKGESETFYYRQP